MRHIPEAGAVCVNCARTDLRGGRGVTSVPTATTMPVQRAIESFLLRDSKSGVLAALMQ